MKVPPELEVEILSRLPVKSLLRFRCVSKEWLRLLTVDTNFINNIHLPRSLKANSTNPNPSLISLSEYEVGSKITRYIADYRVTEGLKGVVKPLHIHLPVKGTASIYICKCVGICNGLVCLEVYTFSGVYLILYIWNPLTREHITLSYSTVPSLLQPPIRSFIGFGFHQPTNQYKVVRILTTDNQYPHISVYTLGTKTWRNLGFVSYDFWFHDKPITINGSPHWSLRRKESESSLYYRLIVYFDFKDEVLKEIPLPFPPDCMRITEFSGLLCIFGSSNLEDYTQMWVMKEHGVASSWTKLFKIGKFEMPGRSSLWCWSPIGIALNGEITLRNYYEIQQMQLLIYNPKTNSFKGPIKFDFFLEDVFVFAGSLISPKVINGGAQEITLTEEI